MNVPQTTLNEEDHIEQTALEQADETFVKISTHKTRPTTMRTTTL